jgi:hypothetical protein
MRPTFPTLTLAALALGFGSLLGCASEPSDEASCQDGKCDDPGTAANRECREMCKDDAACFQECRDGAALDHCTARRSDALDGGQKAYTANHIRWACADVAGVNTNGGDDRGQEYCEYFAVVQPPPRTEGGELPRAASLGRNRPDQGPTQPGLSLNETQIFALEDNADSVVGQCIFTSWHADITDRLPICGGADVRCPALSVPTTAKLPPWTTKREIGSFKMTSEMVKMKVGFNSNGAASDLLDRCMTEPPAGDPADPADPLHDDYLRGCWKSYETFGTEWRRSDPTICAAGVRLAECGCGVDTDGDGKADITDPAAIARAVVPPQPEADGSLKFRGFQLGTWASAAELPAGCRYMKTGDDNAAETIVSCDLTASDVLASQKDVKQKCREKYGDNVVVHIPVPASAVVCTPPADGQYSASCSAMPWVLESTPAAN